MATWVTHLMIADGVLAHFPGLHRRGFCVGNIAPDCNVENADWPEFTPSREVTHWMHGTRKKASDCDAFCDEYILKRKDRISSAEEYAFLLGYYTHLITDAAFQAMIRNDERVAAVGERIKADGTFSVDGMEETWDSAKKLISHTKRRAPKPENGEKNMFADLLYCGDCGSKLWFHVNSINKIQYFSCSNYAKDYRGSCPQRHYIRADAIELVVKLELQRMAEFLSCDEDAFAELLEKKTNKDILDEQKHLEAELQKAIRRNEDVAKLYERLYEDNATGKVSDDWFMQLSHKHELEGMELKKKTAEIRQCLAGLSAMRQNKDNFIVAIRKFMEMDRLTPALLRELVDRIDVYETEGTGKNRTQRVVIHYRFVGYVDFQPCKLRRNIRTDTRKGVSVEYIPRAAAI